MCASACHVCALSPAFTGCPVLQVLDCAGTAIQFFAGAREVLHELATAPHFAGTQIAYASRTDCESWAFELLATMRVGDGTMHSIAHHMEIYPTEKTRHFRALHEVSGIPYHDMMSVSGALDVCWGRWGAYLLLTSRGAPSAFSTTNSATSVMLNPSACALFTPPTV
jgi:hypothetical protein